MYKRKYDEKCGPVITQTPGWMPVYAARIEDLERGELVKVDCAACHHVALLTHEVLDLKERLRCRGCGTRGGR